MTSFTNTTRNYPTGADTPIRRVRTTRDPTTTDNHNFTLGDEWLNTSTQRWWKLCNLTATTAKWVPFAVNETGAIETVTGDTGGPVPPTLATGNLNLLGTAGQITVTGNPATNTLTLALAGGGTAVDSFSPDTGTDPVVPTATGLVNIKGQSVPNVSGIRVTGALNELDIAMFSPFAGDFTFTDSTSGATETLTVSNTSNTASSQAQINAVVAGGTAGDAWNQWTVGTSRSYGLGIDNSNSDIFKLTSSASATIDPSSGTTLVSFDPVGSPSGNNFVNIPSPEVHIEFSGATEVVNLTVTNTNAADFANIIAEAVGPKTGFFSSGIYTTPLYWNFGMASTLSNAYCLNTASSTQGPEGGTIVWKMTTTGAYTTPLQPSFMASLASPVANVTGDGTAYTVLFDTENFDLASNYNPATGIFTAPEAGRYSFYAQILLTSLGAAHTGGQIALQQGGSGTAFFVGSDLNPAVCRDLGNNANDLTMSVQGMISLSAGDTMKVVVTVTSSTKTVGVFGGAAQYYSSFGGRLDG